MRNLVHLADVEQVYVVISSEDFDRGVCSDCVDGSEPLANLAFGVSVGISCRRSSSLTTVSGAGLYAELFGQRLFGNKAKTG